MHHGVKVPVPMLGRRRKWINLKAFVGGVCVCVCVLFKHVHTHSCITPVSSASSLPSHPSGSGLCIPEQPFPVTSITLPAAVTLSPEQA